MTTFATTILALAMLAFAVEGTTKPAPAAVDCSQVVMNMAGCLPFVTDNSPSTTEKPQVTCCRGLKLVLETNVDCLCVGLKMATQTGQALNITKALALPQLCSLPGPSPASLASCGVALPPAGSPASTPSTPKAPSSETGPTETPAAAPAKPSSSSSTGVSAFLIISGLFAALFTSF